jgi:hypothetical protein
MSRFPYVHDTMSPPEARQALFVIIHAMAAVVDQGRFTTAYDDPAQHFCRLMQLFVRQLEDIYCALSTLPHDTEGGAV